MKIMLLIFVIYIITLPCYADLTQNDLYKISNIIDQKLEPIKQDIVNIKLDVAEMRGKVVTKEWILTMWITIFLSILAVPYLYGRSDRERVKALEECLKEDEKR